MPCNEVRAVILVWLGTGKRCLALHHNDQAITPQRPKGGVMLRVQLIHQRPENALLETWLHAGENRLPPWQGALAQDPMTGQLWLVQWMTCDRCDRLFTHLDAPLNPCSAG